MAAVFPEKGVTVVRRKGRMEDEKGALGSEHKREGGTGGGNYPIGENLQNNAKALL
jgi:hypothetical protein